MGGVELLNQQAGDQCITLTRVKNNRLVSRNEPVCNYSLACLLRSVPALARRQVAGSSQQPSPFFSGLGLGFFLHFLGVLIFFSPLLPSKSKVIAPCLGLGSLSPASSKAPGPVVPTTPWQSHVVPWSPRNGDTATSPCSGTSQPKACSRVLPCAALACPMHISLQHAGTSTRGSARGEPRAHVLRVHMCRVCPHYTPNARAQACEGTRANPDVHAQAAAVLQYRCPWAPCSGRPRGQAQAAVCPQRVPHWQSHPLACHCHQHPGLFGKPSCRPQGQNATNPGPCAPMGTRPQEHPHCQVPCTAQRVLGRGGMSPTPKKSRHQPCRPLYHPILLLPPLGQPPAAAPHITVLWGQTPHG